MIISKAPCRLTLGGGGTDLPSYYEKRGGFTVTGAINKYVFVGAYKQFYDNIKLKYSMIEEVSEVDYIKHPLFREALRLMGITNNIELSSLADIPSGTGLGSSGAFLVALLNTLQEYKNNESITKRVLASEACKIELDILKLHEGKQDKYACAFGGIKAIEYLQNGQVAISSFSDEDGLRQNLSENLHLFYTGRERRGITSEALKYQDTKCLENDDTMLDYLDDIRLIGYRTREAFKRSSLDSFGRLLNDHWEVKKQYSPYATDAYVDECYKKALDCGALGGKLMGAGGGGFLLFYYPGKIKERWNFIDSMEQMGLQHTEFKFDTEGVTTVLKE